jgi:DNA-binding beta-propeller fold protein YncE
MGGPTRKNWKTGDGADRPSSNSTLVANGSDFWAGAGAPSACAFPRETGAAQGGKGSFYSLEEDIAPLRSIVDPFPSFNGIAVDPANNRLVMSDSNRKSLIIYDRLSKSNAGEATRPLGQVIGPVTQIGFVAGVTIDPVAREMYAVSNDIEDVMVAFSYDAQGNAPPRVLAVPHGAWGLSLNRARNEIAMSVEHENAIFIFRRAAEGFEPPLRVIQGPGTQMADPHGVSFDAVNQEIAVANHGNVNTRRVANDQAVGSDAPVGGRFVPPSIVFYPATAKGDTKPLRVLQGDQTQLDWPMGIDIDSAHAELAVANNGDHSVLIFRRADGGNVAPLRVIRGAQTKIRAPMGVAFDSKNDEIWVANFGDHTAVVFDRTASGNAAPKRIIRSAPAAAPTGGFGNPMAVGYDTKREEILVPN